MDRFHGDNLVFARALNILADEKPDIIFFPDIGMETTTTNWRRFVWHPFRRPVFGHPITSGLPTIDLYFSGELLEVAAGRTSTIANSLVRLPGTGVCTEGLPFPSNHSTVRCEHNAADVVDFALCQNPFKFDPADDDLYPRIAKLADPCRFWLL